MLNKAGAKIRHQIDRCSKCGSCRDVCPVFGEMGAEPWVARARVQLLNAILEGKAGFSDRMAEIMEACLLCKACVANCPNGVQVDVLVLAARAEIAARGSMSPVKKAVLRNVLRSGRRLDLAARLLSAYRSTGLQRGVRRSGLLGALSKKLALKEKLIPPVRPVPFRQRMRLSNPEKPLLHVAYFTGCMTQYVYQETGEAVLHVLRENGVAVSLPEQCCCGMPAWAAGDLETARELAQRNVESFMKMGADYIITDCASCGEMLRHYPEILEGETVREFSAKVQDISRFLVNNTDFRCGLGEVPLSVTYHDPCHLKRGQCVCAEPREILKSIPGLKFLEMAEADRCCGSAGSFNLTHYDLSMKVLERKVENITDTSTEMVVTGCPSCRLQIEYGLRESGKPLPVVHTVELLSRAYKANR